MTECPYPECKRKVAAKGWCASHYRHIYVLKQEPRPIKPRLSPIERLWARVEKTKECWLWLGACSSKGYGVIGGGRTGSTIYTHRLVWESINGPIPAQLEVCHLCDVPRCVRPDHLFLGTHRQNMTDMARKLRSGVAVLTEGQVREVMRLRSMGLPRRDILQATGINLSTLKDLLRGKNWSHITGWGR